jgi:nicotinamidase-related amidase
MLDFQAGTFDKMAGFEVGFMPGLEELPIHVAAVAKAAKAKGVYRCFVTVGFRPGFPEIGPHAGSSFQMVKANGLLIEGTPPQVLHSALTAEDDDLVLTKHRYGVFEGTHLDQSLRSRGIDTIAIAGVSTRGAVLSAVRAASDKDYRIIVLSDCCADNNKEVHQVLLENILPMQAEVTTSAEWLDAIVGERE